MNQVLIEKIKQDLRVLRLKDMAEVLEAVLEKAHQENQGYLQFFYELVQKQLDAVRTRSLERRIRKAQFPHKMAFDNFDWGFQPGLNVEYLKDRRAIRNRMVALDVLDKRASYFKAEKLILGDKYTFIKDAYLQKRANLIADGAFSEVDPFLDDED